MASTDDRTGTDVPWYRMRSSIVMITVSILAVMAILLDPLARDITPAATYRIVENGVIVHRAQGL